MSRRRLLGAAALVALLASASWAIWAWSGPEEDWVAVRRGDLVLTVEVSGTLKSVVADLIGPPNLESTWQYKIAFMAPEGEEVAAGTRVLGFDTSELTDRLQQEVAARDAARKRIEKAERETEAARAADTLALAEAEARLRKAELKVDRPDEVVAAREQAILRLDLELAQKEVAYLRERLDSHGEARRSYLESLSAQRAQAEQTVAETESAIAQMERLAPRAGTVVYVTDWQAQKKSVGDSTWRGESVIELPDLARLQAMGQVHEADAGRLAEGQRVTLRLDAHPDLSFSGRIARIWKTVGRESSRSRLKVFNVEIELDETDTRRMRPGMRFRGKIEVEQVRQALLVPTAAVALAAEGPVAWRRGFGGPQAIAVQVGRRGATEIEVLAGLAEGDLVAAAGPRREGVRP